MPDPTTSLRDDFNRADELPIASANWTSPAFTAGTYAEQQIAIFVNELCANGGGNATGYWDAEEFGEDQEVWMTVADLPAVGAAHLFARMQGVGTGSATMYVWRLTIGGQWDLYSVVANSATFKDTGSLTFSAGDGMWLHCVGTTITGYHKPVAGSWTQITQITDSDVTGNGYIGVMANDTTMRFDDFGGGALGPAPQSFYMTRQRMVSR